MFYVVAKEFSKSRTFTPMQVASSFDEARELIAGIEQIFTNSVEEQDRFVDTAGNLVCDFKAWNGRSGTNFRVTRLLRS